MLRCRQIVVLLLALGLLPPLASAARQNSGAPRTKRVKASARARQADPPNQAQPAPPPPPPTLEQQPPQPPQVSYLNGQLLIISRNSTLAEILSAVRRQTGAVIELPPGAGMERVAGRMGPGSARDVLSELLNGSRYDYVMIASASNPRGLEHVILTPKSNLPEGPSMASNPGQPQPGQPQVVPDQGEMTPDAGDDQEVPVAEEPPPPEDQPQPQPQGMAQPGQPYPQQPGSPQQPGVKTPQQLLQELQRMQTLQQQQQQQQQQQEQQQQQ